MSYLPVRYCVKKQTAC